MAHPEQDDVIVRVDSDIVIRRWRDEDAKPMAHHGTNPNVWNQLSDRMPQPYTVQDAKDWIVLTRKADMQRITGPSLEDNNAPRIPTSYVIVIDGAAGGTVGLAFQSGVYRLNATLGYWLGEEFHSRGIMSRAIPAFIQWTWKTFGYLNRLNGTAYEHNVKSQKVMQRAGFVMESTRINACIKNGVVYNEVTLAALRPEGV